MTNDNINIALVEDHEIVRRGVGLIISGFGKNYTVVLDAANGREFLDKLKTAEKLPDVCVLDLMMDEMNGYETLAVLQKEYPTVKVLILSAIKKEFSIIKAFTLGARGYLIKGCNPKDLHKAIDAIFYRGFYYSDTITRRVSTIAMKANDKTVLPKITPREQEFLVLCCSELTYVEIADKMDVSLRTVDAFRDSIFLKLDIKSRAGLVLFAIQNGMASMF